MFTNHIYVMYMHEQDLVLNKLQCLIGHKTKHYLILKVQEDVNCTEIAIVETI